MRARGGDFSARRRFEFACLGLLDALAKACLPRPNPSPLGQYIAGYGEPVGVAVWEARYVMRQARRLGLYPTMAALEREQAKREAA